MQPSVIVTVGTSWDSSRGGLSTFNRFLSVALVRTGVRVIMAVQDFDDAQRMQARNAGVELVCLEHALERLRAERVEAVIGHGRITGPNARRLSEPLHAKRVHFVHMWAESIEPPKGASLADTMATVAERGSAEAELAQGADLVVAVGPRLQRSVGTRLRGDRQVLSFLPGLITELTTWNPVRIRPGREVQLRCLVMARAALKDISLKGFDIAASAVAGLSREALSHTPDLVVRGLARGEEEAVRRRLEELRKGAEPSFHYRPFTVNENEVEQDFHEATVFLMPSREEGFGLVGLDAIALGVPCLVSSKSGLGDMLHDFDLAERVVVRVTGDWQTDTDAWRVAVADILRDPEAAFRRAANLREALGSRLSWSESVKTLLQEIRTTGTRASGAGPSTDELLDAALHLDAGLDAAAAARTRAMVQALMEHDMPAESRTGVVEQIAQTAAAARRRDADASIMLSVAISTLRAKYLDRTSLFSDASAYLPRYSLASASDVPLPSLKQLFDLGAALAKDLQLLPDSVLEYARLYGLHPHAAVLSSSAAGQIELGLLQLGRGSRPQHYELENLARVISAADQLMKIDVSAIPLGFMNDGEVDARGMRSANELIALTLDADNAPAVVVFGRHERNFRQLAKYRARKDALHGLAIRGNPERRAIFAGSGRHVYRWGLDGATPERTHTTSDEAQVASWDAWTDSTTQEVRIESVEGHGIKFRGEQGKFTWAATTRTALFWHANDGACLRIALRDGRAELQDESRAVPRTSKPIPELLRDRLPGDISRLDPPREVWPGSRNGGGCFVLPCGADGAGVVLALIDVDTLELARAPVVSSYPVEECRVIDAGHRSYLIATLMRGPAPLAVWDVTGDGEAPIATYGPPGRAGFCLAGPSGPRRRTVYFTVRWRPDRREALQTELWSWEAGRSGAERLFDVAGYVSALDVAGA